VNKWDYLGLAVQAAPAAIKAAKVVEAVVVFAGG
jgi:hypothetical protein